MAKKLKRAAHAHLEKIAVLGGQAILKQRGPEYFSELSKRRKTHSGGRPAAKKRSKK